MQLSHKPSKAIEQALADLAKVEASEDYKIDMGIWHTMIPGDRRCSVCLAGAVIAQRVSPDRDTTPSHFEDDKRLIGLDYFRRGDIDGGLMSFGLHPADYYKIPLIMAVTEYDGNPAEFKRDLQRIADTLKEAWL